jgi:hypothetical protein
MATKKRNHSELKIDESSMAAETSMISRFLNALYAIVLGIVLIQVYHLFIGIKSLNVFSVVLLFDNIFFLAYLGACSILGWIAGDSFIVWLKEEIGNWKFW